MKELSPVPPDALAVETRDLRKEFVRKDRKRGKRRVAALEDVTLEIARGECVAILGQNGSGKSTLVRLLSTLLLPDGGSARVFGYDVVREDKAGPAARQPRLGRGELLQEDVAVGEPPLRGALLRHDAVARRRSRSPRSSERVGFPPDRRTEPMENLSRGMQQKVALARALLTSPVLLLLDEPTTGLDPRSKLEVQDFIREMRALHDSTILLCTHDLDEAEALAERVGILDRGRLLALEPADELKARLRRGDARGGVLRRHRPRLRGRGGRAGRARRGRCSRESRRARAEARADRPRRRRRAQRLPHAPLHLLGRRVLRLDGREHAHDRLHRRGDRGDRRRRSTSSARRRRSSSAPSSGPTSGSSSSSSPRPSPGSAGRARSSTRSWRRSRGRCTSAARASSRCSTGSSARSCCSSSSRCSSASSSTDANFAAALVILIVASVSFFGIGMMTAVLPLISPEKGAQLGFVAQGMLLVVSGVYYPVEVLPRVDAVALDDLARDVRAGRDPRGDPRRRLARRRCGTTSGRS